MRAGNFLEALLKKPKSGRNANVLIWLSTRLSKMAKKCLALHMSVGSTKRILPHEFFSSNSFIIEVLVVFQIHQG